MPVTVTVGTNSYVSLADAKTYVLTSYNAHTGWDAATDDQKSIALLTAAKKIERGVYRGIKALATQTLQFPRAIRTDYNRNDVPTINITLDNQWVIESVVAQRVIDAQCEEATALLENSATSTMATRLQLQAQGVKSFSLGNLSESYSMVDQSGTKLLSKEAKELLAYYTTGGIMIR